MTKPNKKPPIAHLASDYADDDLQKYIADSIVNLETRLAPGDSRILTITIHGAGIGIGCRQREQAIDITNSGEWGVVFQLRAIGETIRAAYKNNYNTEQLVAVAETAELLTIEVDQDIARFKIGSLAKEGMLAAIERLKHELDPEFMPANKKKSS